MIWGKKTKQTRTCKKLGTNAWLACLNCGIEALVWLKFSKGMFPNPWPPAVIWTWGICIVGFIIWSVVFFTLKHIRTQKALASASVSSMDSLKKKD